MSFLNKSKFDNILNHAEESFQVTLKDRNLTILSTMHSKDQKKA